LTGQLRRITLRRIFTNLRSVREDQSTTPNLEGEKEKRGDRTPQKARGRVKKRGGVTLGEGGKQSLH